jgi:hypothetical protein
MKEQVLIQIRDWYKGAGEVIYHIIVVALSAWAALSLPHAADVAAQTFAIYWPAVEKDKAALVAIEITIAVLLMICLNYLRRSIRDKKLAEVARRAGLTNLFSPTSPLSRRTIRQLKTDQGRAKHIMILGSTGYNTFVDPTGDLHTVIWKCLEAKVMLLNPYSEAARARMNAILEPKITHETLTEQVRGSIELFKQLKAGQKSVRLKLYSDPPHVKLAILGNAIWLQHYHTGLDVHSMPEYLFRQNQNDYGLYTLFYQYFTKRWESPEIPEYDLETDELVYRGSTGNEIRRELFPKKVSMPPTAFPAAPPFRDMGLQDR